jgi:hypothetical protein
VAYEKKNRVWNETKLFLLPLMPTEQDEKDVFIEKEFRCTFCDELCDEMNLECKVCSKVYHLICLFQRGHLNTLKVPLRDEWTCADCVIIIIYLLYNTLFKAPVKPFNGIFE